MQSCGQSLATWEQKVLKSRLSVSVSAPVTPPESKNCSSTVVESLRPKSVDSLDKNVSNLAQGSPLISLLPHAVASQDFHGFKAFMCRQTPWSQTFVAAASLYTENICWQSVNLLTFKAALGSVCHGHPIKVNLLPFSGNYQVITLSQESI